MAKGEVNVLAWVVGMFVVVPILIGVTSTYFFCRSMGTAASAGEKAVAAVPIERQKK